MRFMDGTGKILSVYGFCKVFLYVALGYRFFSSQVVLFRGYLSFCSRPVSGKWLLLS